MQFNKEQKQQLRGMHNCMFMDLDDSPISSESWECLGKPRVWSVVEKKRVYGIGYSRITVPDCTVIMVAIDTGLSSFAVFEDNKLLDISSYGQFTYQFTSEYEREVLVVDKDYYNAPKCIWI